MRSKAKHFLSCYFLANPQFYIVSTTAYVGVEVNVIFSDEISIEFSFLFCGPLKFVEDFPACIVSYGFSSLLASFPATKNNDVPHYFAWIFDSSIGLSRNMSNGTQPHFVTIKQLSVVQNLPTN